MLLKAFLSGQQTVFLLYPQLEIYIQHGLMVHKGLPQGGLRLI